MDPTETMARGGPPSASGGFPLDSDQWLPDDPWLIADPAQIDDAALIDLAVRAMVAQNRAHAARLEAMSRFHGNRVAEIEAGGRSSGFFGLTPLQATKAEFAPVLAVGELAIQIDLDVTNGLKEWFPTLWHRCLDGRIDVGRARLAFDQLANLTSDADKRAFAELVAEYLDKVDDPRVPVCPVKYSSFQQALRRRCLKFPQRDEQHSYAEAYKKRRVTLRSDENGMATITAITSSPDALVADYRLTLIAKKLGQSDGETRTLEQLRADVLVDLIQGRLTVGAADGELEDDAMSDGRDPMESFATSLSVGAFARPIINVTVPVTTLLGLSDEPGELAGGTSLPADLVRELAMHPVATWYRLLTDPAGGFLELSTDSYAPTEAIWRWVVARDRTCIWPGCGRPASVVELDHRVPFPIGKTSTQNLQPLCRKHHLVKHSTGFEVVPEADGSYTWTSRFGSVFRTPAPEYPVPLGPEDDQGVPSSEACDHIEACHHVDAGDPSEACRHVEAGGPSEARAQALDVESEFRSIMEREFEAVIAGRER